MVIPTLLTLLGDGLPVEFVGAITYDLCKGKLEELQAAKNHDLAIAVVDAWRKGADAMAKLFDDHDLVSKKQSGFFTGLREFAVKVPPEDIPAELVLALTVGQREDYRNALLAYLPQAIAIIQQEYTTEQEWEKHEWYGDAISAFEGALLAAFAQAIKQPKHERAFKGFVRDNFRAVETNQQITVEMLDEVLDKLDNLGAGDGGWLQVSELIMTQNQGVIDQVELVRISVERLHTDISSKLDRILGIFEGQSSGMRDQRDDAQKALDQMTGQVVALQEQLQIRTDELVDAKVKHATNLDYLQGQVDKLTAELQSASEALAQANLKRNDPSVDALVRQARELIAAGEKERAYALFDSEDQAFAERKIQKMFVQLENADWELAMETWFAEKLKTNEEQKLRVAEKLHDLAFDAHAKGSYFELLPLQIEVLELSKRVLGDEHPHTLVRMNNLGSLYQSQGRYSVAEPLYLDVLRLRKRVLGEEHPDTLVSMNNLGSLYQSQGRYQEAEPLYVDALRLLKKVLGEEHPNTLNSMNNLGELYRSQVRYTDAAPLLADTLTLRKKILGEEHPDTLNSMNNLGFLYASQGRYQEAEPLYVDTLRLRKKVLGEEHPHTVISMNNLGRLYASQGRYTDAEPLFAIGLSLSIRVLGEEHPNTLGSLNNLGGLYQSQGRYEEAEPLYLDALRLTKKVLGEEHPNTLTSMNNLAFLRYRMGDLAGCFALFKEAEKKSRYLNDRVPVRAAILQGVQFLRIEIEP